MSSTSPQTSHYGTHGRPAGRIPSNSSSSSASSSWQPPKHWSVAVGPDDMAQQFTPEMRDRQALGKDPYLLDVANYRARSGPVDMGLHSMGGEIRVGASRHPKGPFHKTERRDWAETVLDNPELLMMYAQSSGDTLPATRYKFRKIMCGLDEYEDDDVSLPDLPRGGLYQYQSQNQNSNSHHQPQQRFNVSASSAQREGRR